MENFTNFEINSLLKEWNLSHLQSRLAEQGITIDVLHMLKTHHIERLLCDFTIGDLVKFEFHLDQFKTKHAENNLDKQETSNSSRTKISVMDILKSTYNGREILKFYKKNSILYEEQRNLLINTITKYIEANGVEYSLSECSAMEKEIVSIFPSEELELYTNGKRGKIYNKLAHLKRLSKDVLKKSNSLPPENLSEESDENVTFYLQHLKSDKIAAEEFDLYWRKCAAFRFKQIFEATSTAEIFKLWPEYIKSSGFLLIEIDFSIKFPMAKNLHDRWSQFGENILRLLKTKITNAQISRLLQDVDGRNEESKTFMIFWFLHYLFPPQQKTSTDASGSKMRKKYSIADSQESFAIIAATEEELEIKLKLLRLQTRNIQPRILIIGEEFEIKAIFVYVDEVKYTFLKFLNAFDALFKIFFVFNLQYPEESDIYYNFIQLFLYDLPTVKKYTKVSAIRHEILKNLNIN